MFRREPPESALAVVGQEWITRADVIKALQDEGVDSVSEREIARYVNNWVDTNLLLHEARRQNLQNDPEIKKQLADLEQELLINRLLETNTEVDTPSSQQIVDYWKVHTGEYTRVANEVTLVIAHVPTSSKGWQLRNGFDQSLDADQMRDEIGATRIDTLRYISASRLPKAIAEGIEPLKTGQSSLPIHYQDEYLVIKLLDKYRAGKTRSIEEVQPLVKVRMMAEEKSRRKLDYIEALRREARQSGLVRIRFEDTAQDSLPETASADGNAQVDNPVTTPSQPTEEP